MTLEPGVEYGITDYIENQEAFDALTDEQVQALNRGELVKYGETEAAPTEAAPESSESPAAATETVKEAPVVEQEPVIATKDGKHVIPFKELENAREQARQWEEIAKAQTALAESLKAAKAEDAGTGETKAQDEVMEKFVQDYPELAEALTPAIQKMIDAGVNAKVAALEAKFAEAIAPIQKTAQDNSIEAHFAAIHAAIPDFNEIVEAGAIQAWVEKLPSYVRTAAQAVLDKGTATEIIELFSDYKASLPAGKTAEPVPGKEELAAKAAAAIAKAKSKAPATLSDVPSGSNADLNSDASEATMSAQQLFAKMQNWSPDKILEHLSKAI
jgi:hypothetical protein